MARPSKYNIELCNEICERIVLGEHIKPILDSDDRFPTFPTWCKWKRENDELFNLYTRSIQDKAEMLIFEINQTMQDVRIGNLDASQGRLIIDTYKWMASKFYPKMFGDKVDVTSGDKPIQVAPPQIIFQAPKNEDE
jgi:hypothetical protein